MSRKRPRPIPCALLLALLVPLSAPAGAARADKVRRPEELTNFLLSPQYSQWLVGPIFHIASAEEVAEYLRLRDDAAAAAFITEFWRGRRSQSDSPWPTDQPQAVFERRAEEADRLFSEGTKLGRRTDRGTIHVLYGKPDEVTFETQRNPRQPPVEVWSYGADAEKGLDGEKPKRRYFFGKRGEVTVFSNPPRRGSRLPDFL